MAAMIYLDLHQGLVRSQLDREADGSYRLILRQDRDELQIHLTQASVKGLFVTLLLELLNENVTC